MHRSLRALTFTAALAVAAPALAETVTITFVQTNDIDRMDEKDGRGGLAKVAAVGLPFWLAGGEGYPERVRAALDLGAAGVQIGTPFAFCAESGFTEEIKAEALAPAVDTDLDEGPARDEKRHRKAKAEKPVVAEKADADGDA